MDENKFEEKRIIFSNALRRALRYEYDLKDENIRQSVLYEIESALAALDSFSEIHVTAEQQERWARANNK